MATESIAAWHVHHDQLMELLTEDIEVRRQYIREHKPEDEQALRLRLLQPVRSQFPARLGQAQVAYSQARAAYSQALVAALPKIEALHREECPDCPWDGQSIFPE